MRVDLTRSVGITRLESDQLFTKDDLVIEEYPLSILVNGHKAAALLCSPDALKQLVCGFLLSEDLITSCSDIASIHIDEEKSIAEVELVNHSIIPRQEHELTRSTGCGKGAIYLEVITTCHRNESPVRYSAQSILALSQQFNKMSELFLTTGGVHSAALCDEQEILFFYEDVGRHNAVDKIIGAADLGGINLNDKLLLCSGRISSEMLIKAAKQNVSLVVSRSAPTSLAVELAVRLNITLIGFARGSKMNIYSASERIEI